MRALANRNSKILIALDTSLSDSIVCTSIESGINGTVCAANRNSKTLIDLDIFIG